MQQFNTVRPDYYIPAWQCSVIINPQSYKLCCHYIATLIYTYILYIYQQRGISTTGAYIFKVHGYTCRDFVYSFFTLKKHTVE